MQWGDSIEMLQEVAEMTGVTPKTLAERPSLNQWQSSLYSAFTEMAGSRPYSMAGPLPITIEVFATYATLYDLDRQDAQDLWSQVRAIDAHWLGEVQKRNPQPKTK
jgi:hypothetical protein